MNLNSISEEVPDTVSLKLWDEPTLLAFQSPISDDVRTNIHKITVPVPLEAFRRINWQASSKSEVSLSEEDSVLIRNWFESSGGIAWVNDHRSFALDAPEMIIVGGKNIQKYFVTQSRGREVYVTQYQIGEILDPLRNHMRFKGK